MDDRSNRAQMESEYRSLFGIGTVSQPGLQRLSDEKLNESLTFLKKARDAADDIRRRAAPGLARLREEQALVLGSEVSVREWMDTAMTKWADGGGSSAFHPFAAAVELYGHPLPERSATTASARHGCLVSLRRTDPGCSTICRSTMSDRWSRAF